MSHQQSNKDYIFERYNSKYNRIWEQMTAISVLFFEILAVYFFALIALDNSPRQFLLVTYSTAFFVILTIFLALAVARLEFERTETKRELKPFVGEFYGT